MAQARFDPLDCARTIVLGCLERDFCRASKSDSDICVNTILRFVHQRKSVRIDSPSRGPLNASEGAVAEPSSSPRLFTAAVFPILACVAVVIWFFALVAIRE